MVKTGDLTIAYLAVALLSVALFIFCLIWNKKYGLLLNALFGCVAVVNCGYFFLSICSTLPIARLANAVSYFGAAYCVLIMLLVICDLCHTGQKPWLRWFLFGVSTAAFILAALSDWQGLYYQSLSLETVNGMTCLVKVYGPLHGLYGLYLGVYLLLMIGIITYAALRHRLVSFQYALFLLMAVCLNIGIWAVEQVVDIQFELLSVSYIVTEILLLLIYGMLYDYGIICPETGMVSVQMLQQLHTDHEQHGELPPGVEELFQSFAQRASTLSSAEHRILNYYIEGHEIAEIPELAYISINTVKKHNRSIYQKLQISSRDELMLYVELFRRCNRLHELTGEEQQ